jgi:hypothetical protein
VTRGGNSSFASKLRQEEAVMMLTSTLIVLGLWLALVWFVARDPGDRQIKSFGCEDIESDTGPEPSARAREGAGEASQGNAYAAIEPHPVPVRLLVPSKEGVQRVEHNRTGMRRVHRADLIAR